MLFTIRGSRKNCFAMRILQDSFPSNNLFHKQVIQLLKWYYNEVIRCVFVNGDICHIKRGRPKTEFVINRSPNGLRLVH